MANGADLRRLALALPGVSEAAHFERRAFRAARTFVTLAPDGMTANFMFAPDEQALKCAVAGDAFSPVPNAWGARGATTAILEKLSEAELAAALEIAWRRAQPRPRRRRAG